MFSILKGANFNNVKLKINNLHEHTQQSIRNSFYQIGKNLTDDARKLINEKPKHGRLYRIGAGIGGKRLKNKRNYIASAPGEAPGVITGELRKSVNFVVSNNEMRFGTDMSKGKAPYGKFLEYGNLVSKSGQGSERIKPRPFISGSYAKNKTLIHSLFVSNLKKSLTR
jgi:hypothetical protein